MKSESGSLHFVSLRSGTQTHTFITNIEGFLPIHHPFQILINVRFFNLGGHKTDQVYGPHRGQMSVILNLPKSPMTPSGSNLSKSNMIKTHGTIPPFIIPMITIVSI